MKINTVNILVWRDMVGCGAVRLSLVGYGEARIIECDRVCGLMMRGGSIPVRHGLVRRGVAGRGQAW